MTTLSGLMQAHALSVPSGPAAGPAAPSGRASACTLGVRLEHALVATCGAAMSDAQGALADVAFALSRLLDASEEAHLPMSLRCS